VGNLLQYSYFDDDIETNKLVCSLVRFGDDYSIFVE
jgi:hypothetical protein